MSSLSLENLLRVATEAAYLGGKRTLAYFNTGASLNVEHKGDNTPVTIADREAEQVIRSRITSEFPTHAIVGEEGGTTEGAEQDFRWIVDPIDGTKSFIHGVPLFGVLIGVEVKGNPCVGVIYMPALDEMVCAADGLGCWWNGRRAQCSRVTRLEDACLTTTSPESARKRSDAYARLVARTKLQRAWGDAYGYALVATGRADIMLDPKMNPWDCAPMPPILREAGGRFTNWQGEETIQGDDGVACAEALLDPVLEILRSERR
ncbi:MAG: histidinol-phosphatase [Tepidisphaeraceae bacterium]